MASERSRRLEIFEADYGRHFGWFVEKDGRRLASLTDPRFEDMFWDSYVVEPLVDTDVERDALFTKAFWDQLDLVFRNRVTGEVPPLAYPAQRPPTLADPRIWMRGLHSWLQPTWFERVLLWLRSRSRH